MKLNIWLILDGKRGHEKQVEDLAFCINKIIKSNVTKIQKNSFINIFLNFIGLRKDHCNNLLAPDLIIAAGHQTHLDALQKRRKYGGRIILIMKSTLPSLLFDLSIIPSHDRIFWKKNVLIIDGPVNKIFNKQKQKKNNALILIGGPSNNYKWSTRGIINTIKKVVNSHPEIKFTVAISRRTPTNFINEIEKENLNLKIINKDNSAIDWLEKTIGDFEYSWVTQDSISMLFELIYSGSKVTCIGLDKKNNKFDALFHNLYKKNLINITGMKKKKFKSFVKLKSNADMCAEYVYKNFFNNEKK